MPFFWRSKGQKGDNLSNSEAEYVAMPETVKEIRFISYLSESLGISVTLPIVLRTDNIGAIFMAENASSGVQTKHIDTRYHFIPERIEDYIGNEFIKTIFVRTGNCNQESYNSQDMEFASTSKNEKFTDDIWI